MSTKYEVYLQKQHPVLKVWREVDKTYLHVRCFAHLNRFARVLASARAIASVSGQGLYHLLVVIAL